MSNIDLKEIFTPLTRTGDIDSLSSPITTLLCDVFGTLVDKNRAELDQPLHDFLVRLKEKNIDVVLVSSNPQDAQSMLEKAGCDPLLLANGIADKLTMQEQLAGSEQRYAAIDDDFLIWMDAPIAIMPQESRFREYLSSYTL